MTDRREKVAKFALPNQGHNVFRELDVFYRMGGMNYFNYQPMGRGFYLYSSVIKIEGRAKTWTVGQFGDGYVFLEDAKRFNKKRMAQIVNNVQAHAETINDLIEQFSKEGDSDAFTRRLDTIKALALGKVGATNET